MTVRQGLTVEGGTDLEAACRVAAEAGFEHVELNAEGQFHRSRVAPEAVAETVDSHGLDVVVHLPYRLDVGSPHEAAREGAIRELEAGLDHAAAMGAERAVYHATSTVRPVRWDPETVRPLVFAACERVAAAGREQGVEAVAENVKGPFFDAGDFPALFESTAADGCLDTGHAAVAGYDTAAQAELLRTPGDRIGHVHLNDTRLADDDEHLPVGLGSLDLEPVAAAMRATGWTGTCTHEVFRRGEASWPYVRQGKATFEALLSEG